VTQLGALDGSASSPATDFVEIRLPADGAFLSVLRTATAALAARLNFTIDEIEDLRIAVDEACALVLVKAVPEGELQCRFVIDPAAMTVSVTAPTRDGTPPARDSFAWMVLSALAGDVDASISADQHLTIRMRKERSAIDGAPA
jgi:serine/threonine-protein kinase RsbW